MPGTVTVRVTIEVEEGYELVAKAETTRTVSQVRDIRAHLLAAMVPTQSNVCDALESRYELVAPATVGETGVADHSPVSH